MESPQLFRVAPPRTHAVCPWGYRRLEYRQVVIQLILRDMGPEPVPFYFLVLNELIEDVVPEGLSDQLALFKLGDRFVEVARKLGDIVFLPLLGVEMVNILFDGIGQVVFFLNALEAAASITANAR